MPADEILSAWQYRRFDETEWADAVVPCSWEDLGRPLDDSGPYLWRTSIETDGGPARLEFDAVAYHATVRINGQLVAEHEGMWTPWMVDLSQLTAGAHEVELEVEKVASLTAGPDSPHRPGGFPTRETPSGFLPYVWGHVPGGLWQEVRLVRGAAATVALQTRHADGALLVRITGPGSLSCTLTGADGVGLGAWDATDGQWLRVERPDGAAEWTPDQPVLHTLTALQDGVPVATRAVGFRRLSTQGSTIVLGDAPFHPRFALSWGWYSDRNTPTPSAAEVERDFEALRSLGFNGVKLCLWVPPASYLEVADRMGMAIWLELPMWIPTPNPEFHTRIVEQFREIVDLAVQHPSVVLYTLGCELQSNVSLDLLGELFDELSGVVAPALLCDNSGSGEAYGGHDQRLADFFDHHPYCEPQDLAANLDLWGPRFRDARPWLFGETADQDTFRTPVAQPTAWWWEQSSELNPQGGRWQHDVPWHHDRLEPTGLLAHADELVTRSRARGTAMRKWAIELMRQRTDTSGYVITTERDNPISTAGVLDDDGVPKFPADEWSQFNADTVITLAPPRRVRWRDGDRPSPVDPFVHVSGSTWRSGFVLSHSGSEAAPRSIEWRITGDDFAASGSTGRSTDPGRLVYECGSAEVVLPEVSVPTRLLLEVTAAGARNSWPLWLLPATDAVAAAVYDPAELLVDWRRAMPDAVAVTAAELAGTDLPVVATTWHPALQELVDRGRRVVLLAGSDEHVATVPRPYWRESVALPRPHRLWGDLPLEHWDELAHAVAPRRALALSENAPEPLLTRVDCRTGERLEYAWSTGSLVVTSLALAGGNGAQPYGLATNIVGRWLLTRWLQLP